MITLITKSNAAQYNFLYEQAEKDLKASGAMTEYKLDENQQIIYEHDDEGNLVYKRDENDELILDENDQPIPVPVINHITSLEEYFSYIKELSVLNKKKYTPLPLDEDVFEIDLNTRAIVVPPAFVKNGISVQGDEIAEVVYFRCNRYFDAVDLQTRDVFIQWESAGKGEDGKAIKGVSVPWSVDYESEPGYIIIGWPLSTKITSTPGQVKFSVRFYEWNEDLQQITYSLSTLVQTATIKPGFDYDLKEIITDGSIIDDARDLILDRFENTVPVNASGQAAEPEIIGYLVRKGDVTFTVLDPDTKFERQCLGVINGFTTGDIELAVAALSEDAGRLTFEWKRQALPQIEGQEPQFVAIPSEFKYIVTTDTQRQTGKLYFEQIGTEEDENENIIPVYQIYNGVLSYGDDVPEQEQETLPTIYERVSVAKVHETGRYKVVITNRVNNATGTITSLICLVPAPEAPVINVDGDVAPRAILAADEYTATIGVNAVAPDEGTLTYQWYHIAPGSEEREMLTGDENYGKESSLMIKGTSEVMNGVAIGDGMYFCEITNNLNKEENMIVSGQCRVTHKSSAPVVELGPDTFQNMRFTVAAASGISVNAYIRETAGESRTDEDTLTYQWYRYVVGSDKTSEQDHTIAASGNYQVDNDMIILEANAATYIPVAADAGKVLFCEVTNTYNGDTTSICSPFIDLQDV